MSDGDALLKAVLAHPADDTPRLVYADWLDEHGQPERAEFIRVQCELARYLPSRFEGEHVCRKPRRVRVARDAIGPTRAPCGRCRPCVMDRRERELYATSAEWLLPELPEAVDGVVIERHEFDLGGGVVGLLRRGFATELILPAATWREHATGILAAQPVSVFYLPDARLILALCEPETEPDAIYPAWTSILHDGVYGGFKTHRAWASREEMVRHVVRYFGAFVMDRVARYAGLLGPALPVEPAATA